MTIRHALLAILDQAPCYGNQLRAEYDRRTGAAWPLNVGQVYTTLDRLEQDGLVRSGERDPQGHLFYEITEAGRRDVGQWFASPLEHASASRDDIATKVALALTLDGVDVGEVLQVQRDWAQVRLESLRRHRSGDGASSADLAADLILEAMIVTAESEIQWLDLAEARIRGAGDSAVPLPLNTRAPRRGRPKNA